MLTPANIKPNSFESRHRVSVRVWTLCCFHSFVSIKRFGRRQQRRWLNSYAEITTAWSETYNQFLLIDSASIYCTTRHPDGRVSGVPPHCSSCGHYSKTESPVGRHQMSARLSRTSAHWVCTHSFFQQSSGPHISYICTLGLYTLLLSAVIRPAYLVHLHTRSVHTPSFSKRSSGNAPVH